jgi:hypothetical protein
VPAFCFGWQSSCGWRNLQRNVCDLERPLMTTKKVVLCMRWGSLYGAEYVNVLYRAVKAHLPGAFRFVCLSDDATGIDPAIEVFPIPRFGLKDTNWEIGAWPKLAVFGAELYGLTGRGLFIDMDTMIFDDLTPFFTAPGEIITIDAGINWRKSEQVGPAEVGTGIFAFDLGQMGYVFDTFQQDQAATIATHGIEQRYVQHMARDMRFWPAGWVQSFKYHQRGPALSGVFRQPSPPVNTKVLAFHGTPRPVDLLQPWWGEFPHIGRGPVSWAQQYWQRYL